MNDSLSFQIIAKICRDQCRPIVRNQAWAIRFRQGVDAGLFTGIFYDITEISGRYGRLQSPGKDTATEVIQNYARFFICRYDASVWWISPELALDIYP